MKHVFTFLITLVLAISLFAETASYEDALQVANLKLQIQEKEDYTIADVFEMKENDGSILSYVFQLEPVGFIAVSADTDISPVIGYSFRNNFVVEDTWQNIGYQYLKGDMQLRLEAIAFTSEEVKYANRTLWRNYLTGNIAPPQNRDGIWPPEGYSPTGGWIATQWNQSPQPYWSFCPLDPGTMQRCYVGCTATAMSQIMHYHRWIGDASFDDTDDYYANYTNPPIHIDDDYLTLDFPSFPQLNPYLEDLKVAYANYDDPTNDMISALSFATGVSIEMDYSSNGSGAPINAVYYALLNKYGYDTASYTDIISNVFYDNLQIDMMEARPAEFGISASGADGHAIICDGYNSNDGNYHLNFGWGGSSNGWFSLPTGMPSGYNIIHSSAFNIEGGAVPFHVQGQIYVTGAPVEDTYVTIDGPLFFDCEVDDPDGYFELPYIYEGTYQATAVIELDEGGYFYETHEVVLDENNNILIFLLDSYETITGTVTAPVSPENCHINLYQDNQLKTAGVVDASGNYTMTGVLPGEYVATASLDGNYYDEIVFEITAQNQVIDFELEHYPYDNTICFASESVGQFQLLPDISVAIRVAEEDLVNIENDAFAKIEFIAPFNPADGEIYGQIWKDDLLISEKQTFDFTDGDWVEVVMENFAPIDLESEYFIGYRIHSLSGAIPAAYHDAGPRVEGKGAYIKISGWIPLAPTFDYNFCIKAIAISQNSSGSNEIEVPTFVTSLGNNYPNPFNPQTTISFSLYENNFIKLEIFNIRGQLVKTLISDNYDAGVHSAIWNGMDNRNNPVGSGIYLYKLETENYSSTKKMILLK
ncbi:MAG: C10 family peptidase [Armatimonadetes bacterium]|nr:C10 family peptidase [Armatimonadota bacterium]